MACIRRPCPRRAKFLPAPPLALGSTSIPESHHHIHLRSGRKHRISNPNLIVFFAQGMESPGIGAPFPPRSQILLGSGENEHRQSLSAQGIHRGSRPWNRADRPHVRTVPPATAPSLGGQTHWKGCNLAKGLAEDGGKKLDSAFHATKGSGLKRSRRRLFHDSVICSSRWSGALGVWETQPAPLVIAPMVGEHPMPSWSNNRFILTCG